MYNISSSKSKSISTILSAPPSAGATVEINGTQLTPSPFVNATLEKNIVDDIIIGGVLRVELNGTIVEDHFPLVLNKVNEVINTARNSDCTSLLIECDGSRFGGYGKIVSASVSEGNLPTWTRVAPYTIEIELYVDLEGSRYVMPENTGTPASSVDPDLSDLVLSDLSEQFSISIDEDSFNWGMVDGSIMDNGPGVGRKHVKVSFNISAKGQTGGEDCVDKLINPSEPPQEQYYGLAAVEQYMLRRFARLKNMDLSGLKNKPEVEIIPALEDYRGASFLDFRTLEVNPITNSMTLSGDIIYRPSGCYEDVFTNVTVEESLDTDGNQITISGEIIGLVDSDYQTLIHNVIYLQGGACTTDIKMSKAEGFFNKFRNEDNLKSIAFAHFSKSYIVDSCGAESAGSPLASCFPEESISPTPDICELRLISSQVSKDYAEGRISFSFVFSNKQDSCSIAGVSSLEIEATHDIPRDNIVEILVPGRGKKGVLTQNLCVLSADRWTFAVNMTLKSKKCSLVNTDKKPPELRACALSLLDKFIQDAEIDPDPKASCWFITDNQETLGRNSYRYNIQYTKPSCP